MLSAQKASPHRLPASITITLPKDLSNYIFAIIYLQPINCKKKTVNNGYFKVFPIFPPVLFSCFLQKKTIFDILKTQIKSLVSRVKEVNS